jgi:hypothetical protein
VIDLTVHDSISVAAADTSGNPRIVQPGDHYVAFWANTAAGPMVVRAAQLDSDGDGLYDHWEQNGIDVDGDGMAEIDLSRMGANPRHKDVFVEVDAMAGRAPMTATLDRVVAAFAAAPNALVNNPDRRDGVQLHVVLDDTSIPLAPFPNKFADFQTVKRDYFGTFLERGSPNILFAKELSFRYAIFADTQGMTSSSGLAELSGNDFMVTLGAWSTPGGTPDEQAGTFMHELGHTLGLNHGGNQPGNPDSYNFKPNYYSVMNYLWQTPQTYAPILRLDYSRERLPDLNENNLDEYAGIGGPAGVLVPVGPWSGAIRLADMSGPVDWSVGDLDGDGIADNDTGIRADINHGLPPQVDPMPSSPGQSLTGFEDWSHLVYNFRDSPYFRSGAIFVPPPNETEMTLEIHEALSANVSPLAHNDTVSTSAASPVVIPVLDNDRDLDGSLRIDSVVIVAQPRNGRVVIDPVMGWLTYTPIAGFQGVDRFSYTVTDDDGAISNIATVTVRVAGTIENRPPVLGPIGNKSVNEGSPLTFTASASDPDLGQHLKFSLIGAPDGASINPDTGAFTWTPTEAQGPGTFTFKVRVTDDGSPALFAEEQLTVSVNVIANQVPTITEVVTDVGSPQRSMVRSHTVTFSGLVDIDPGAFELRRQEGGAVSLSVARSDVAGRTQVVLTYTGPEIIGGSLSDGNYTLIIHGDMVRDRSSGVKLDGDGDGVAGGDRSETFFRLFGDTDGDRDVDNLDYARFRSTFGLRANETGFLAFLDSDGNGIIDQLDLIEFSKRRNKRLGQ